MTAKTDSSGKKIPLKWRIIAWWNGYDIADLEERMRQHELAKNARKKDTTSPDKTDNKVLWDEARLKVTQLVWGEGFCGPGGRQNVVDMSKLLALSPKMSAMVIGAGLGGPSRVLAQEFGVWINGYERCEALAEEGMKISTSKGLEKKAPIIHLDLDDNPNFDRVFDRAFSKEVLFLIKNKAPLFKTIFEQLKDDSLFLISDFIIRDKGGMSTPNMVDWVKHEPLEPFPLTAEAMIETLEKVGFSIRIHEDISDHYLDMINAAWENTEDTIKQIAGNDDAAKNNMRAIQTEANLWNRRTKVLRSGELRLYRFLAHKPHAPIK